MTTKTAVKPETKPSLSEDRSGLLQRKCDCGKSASLTGQCSDCQKKLLQRRASNPSDVSEVPPIVHEVLRSPGTPLDPKTRNLMEARFGHDFSQVQIHNTSQANQSAKAVNALAYTVNQSVVFGAGQYSPNTQTGRKLLAHELTHVVQQTAPYATTGQPLIQRIISQSTITQPNDPYEQEADRIADQVVSGGTVLDPIQPAAIAANPPLLQRQSISEGGEAEPQLTRPEEIALSRNSPGEVAGEAQPLALSLYNFGIDVAEPKVEHKAVLTELGAFLNATAAVPVIIRAIGFADSTGAAQYNLHLSRRRSAGVKAFLQPLVTQRISLSAYGETNPAATNDTVSGRTRNRRVDVRFATNLPPTPLPPRPRPVPPGQPPPEPVPPGPKPGGGGGGGGDPDSFCVRHPLLCGLGITPFFLPLICLVNPGICLSATCILVPSLCMIPPIPPIPPDQPQPPDQPPENGRPIVQFVPIVRAPNTPTGMNDRIGLRDPVTVMAIVLNPPAITQPITITVDGRGQNSGDATINGQPQIQILTTTPLQILGTRMSAEGYPYNPYLQLAAWWSQATLIGESNRFAVSTIAEDWSVRFGNPPYGQGRFGYFLNADMDWVSDSGVYSHLNACRYVELVGVAEERGGMVGFGIGDVNDPDDIETADFHPAFDQHGTPFEYTKVAGYSRLKQLFRIRDMRSNSGWAASTDSGFTIERQFERDPANPRCWHLIMKKRGAAVEINGMRSGSGSGDIHHEFRNINCDPPPPKHEDPPPPPPPPPLPPGHDEPPPVPPGPQTLPCDRAELARRVDQCVEDAKQAAVDCTLDLVPFSKGWGGIGQGINYLECLEEMKQELLKCDRRAKADTHCPDSPPPPPPEPPKIA